MIKKRMNRILITLLAFNNEGGQLIQQKQCHCHGTILKLQKRMQVRLFFFVYYCTNLQRIEITRDR
jgi:hypothetical protein